jgi:nucleotide-binding universal stress UspA family protein
MQTLVVPLDLSVASDAVLRPAFATARRSGAEVLLLVARDDADLRALPVGEIEELLARRRDRFAAVAPTRIRVAETEPASAIVEAIDSTERPTVCMATHGRGGVPGAVLGSVAKEVLRRTGAPVLLVGPRCRSAVLPEEQAEIMVSTDGSVEAETVVPVAARFASSLSLGLRVVTVTYPEESVPDERASSDDSAPPDRAVKVAQATLDRCARALRDAGGGAVGSEVLFGADIARSVAQAAERNLSAYLAMATHGRSGLSGALLGSETLETVRRVTCPVLVVSSAP